MRLPLSLSLPSKSAARVSCPRCAAPYLPRLVGWRCPVCDLAAPEVPGRRRPAVDPPDRLVTIVAVATAANVLLLTVLALLGLH